MIDPLTLDRFRELTDCYGAVVARWPEEHRDVAMRMASAPAAIEILAQASGLDETLDSWRVPAPSAELRRRLVVTAPVRGRSFRLRVRLWWSGVGIAAALTGAVAGATAVAMVAPIDVPSDGTTSFGDIGAREI